MNKILNKKFISQFFSYFCVGGISAIVEWVMFFIFNTVGGIDYLIATILAFILSTTTNWILGRCMTFKNSKKYEGKMLHEIALVFAVSIVGLFFNLILMKIFVDVIGLNTDIQRTFSKMMSTGIVFIWNFWARRFGIYKE